jgi:isopenicillin-N epimerase
VRRDRHADVRPLTISHGANAKKPGRTRFRLEFDWTGTADPTAWLTVPVAIAGVGAMLPGGWPAVMARNRALALEARARLCATAGTPPPCPDTMVGSLAAVVLPDGAPATTIGWRRPDPLQARLFEAWSIEVPVITFPAAPRRLIRISAQLYNSREHFARLAEALGKELTAERGGMA